MPPIPPATAPGATPWSQTAPSRSPRWPMFASLAVALVAIGLAIACWVRPLPSPRQSPASTASYTEQQVADAKARVCAAFEKVQHGVQLAHTHAGSNDYATQLAAAALTQVALDAGSRYLLTKLIEEPATPTDIADAVRKEANAEQEALIGYLNGLAASDPSMQPAVSASNEATATVRQLCK